jgi:hypothetical protein
MLAEENKALVHRFIEDFWNEGKTTAADELMAPDAEIHMPRERCSILMSSRTSSVRGADRSPTGIPLSRS